MPKKPRPAHELKDALARLRNEVSSLDATSRKQISDHARRSAERDLADILGRAEGLQRRLDPTTHPAFVLDPGKPTVVARLIALVLLAQPRVPLADTQKSYGSGIYALYYRSPAGITRRSADPRHRSTSAKQNRRGQPLRPRRVKASACLDACRTIREPFRPSSPKARCCSPISNSDPL